MCRVLSLLLLLPAAAGNPKLADIRARVETFASSFPMPGFAVDDLQ